MNNSSSNSSGSAGAPDPAKLRAEMHAGDRARLREIRMQAPTTGPMKHPDHLHAALAFGRLYREATNRRRGSRTRFEDGLREELRAEGLEREHIQVQKLKLPADVTAIDEGIRKSWRSKNTPHRSLRHYLAAVRVAADMLGQDREGVQIAFLRDLPLWRNTPRLDASEEAHDAADALCRLIASMGRAVALDTHVLTTIHRTTCQPMGWNPLTGVVRAVNGTEMIGPISPVHPVCDFGTHISEMRPFPSVSLIRIPMGWIDCDLFVEEGRGTGGAKFRATTRSAGQFKRRRGRMIQYRDIRLALAPLDDRMAGSVLLSQDALAWRDEAVRGYFQDMAIVGEGNWSDMTQTDCDQETLDIKGQQLPSHEIKMPDGWHRVLVRRGDDLDWVHDEYEHGQDWAWDPVERPGEILHMGCGYVSATRLTPDHVYHWLLQLQDLDDERAVCSWESPSWSDIPAPALRSPPFSAARQIEAALHDGRIEGALRDQANSIAKQVAEVLDVSRQAATEAERNLMNRWSRTALPTPSFPNNS